MRKPGEPVVTGEKNGIAVVTINRPERRNALSRELLAQLKDVLGSYEGSSCHAIVLEGSCDCFSAGADLGEISGSVADFAVDDAVAAVTATIRSSSLPVIAAIEGPCIGAGVELAMACDLRVASASAFFRVPSVRLGLLYRPGAIADLARCMPPAVLSRLLLFGDTLGAEQAASCGLVAAPVVGGSQARSRAIELASLLPSPASEAATATKRLLVELVGGTDAHEVATDFEEERRRLIGSPARLAALATAREQRTTLP